MSRVQYMQRHSPDASLPGRACIRRSRDCIEGKMKKNRLWRTFYWHKLPNEASPGGIWAVGVVATSRISHSSVEKRQYPQSSLFHRINADARQYYCSGKKYNCNQKFNQLFWVFDHIHKHYRLCCSFLFYLQFRISAFYRLNENTMRGVQKSDPNL